MNNTAAYSRIHRGVSWNILSFAVISVVGISVNLLIARFYPPWAFGVFNAVMAVFVIAGQIGAMGIPNSMVYHVPMALSQGKPILPIFAAGLSISAVGAALVIGLLHFGQLIAINSKLDPRYVSGLSYAMVGIWFFSINKVMLGFLNGAHRIIAFAIGNAARYLLILASILYCIRLEYPGESLPLCFTVSEIILTLGLSVVCIHEASGPLFPDIRSWLRRHLHFGIRALPSSVIQDLNSRIDILILGLMKTADVVGIYSMASIFALGWMQLIMTLRFSVDPVLAPLIASKRMDELRALVRRVKWSTYAAVIIAMSVSIFIYPFILDIILHKPDFGSSWMVYCLLAIGITFAAGYIPLGGMLQQAGYPEAQSLLLGIVLVINIVGNLLLVPKFGAIGAACGTAFSQIAFVFLLRSLVKSKLGQWI